MISLLYLMAVEWAEGINYMRAFAGDKWSGNPLWGSAHSTWIKVIVD
jgi:hypothetical protein